MSQAVEHPRFARLWAKAAPNAASPKHRAALVARLRGRVVEVGCGTGIQFGFYDPAAEVVGVEPEPTLLEHARRAADEAAVAVEVRPGRAEALPVDDGWADAVVSSLVLCSVADPAAALAEVRRVLRPGGQLRFYEHVVAHPAPGRSVQRALDRTVWPRVAGGCHLSRDTLGAIADAGFDVRDVQRFTVGLGPLGLPHVLGQAIANSPATATT